MLLYTTSTQYHTKTLRVYTVVAFCSEVRVYNEFAVKTGFRDGKFSSVSRETRIFEFIMP